MGTGDTWKSKKDRIHNKNWSDIGFGGHVELILDGIAKDKLKPDGRGAQALYGACCSGDMNVVNMIISAGEKDFTNGLRGALAWKECPHDERYGRCESCSGNEGHIEIARKMIDLGADAKDPELMKDFAESGNFEMCEVLMNAGCHAYDDLLRASGTYGNLKLFSLIPGITYEGFRTACTRACAYGQLKFVQALFPPELANPHIASSLIYYAAAAGQDDVVEYLLAQHADPTQGMRLACKNGYNKTVDLLIKAGATGCECGLPLSEHTEKYSKKRKADAREKADTKWRARLKIMEDSFPPPPGSDDDDT